jgi:predicted secreted protein
VVAVIECIVNQNVRDAGAARSAALSWDALSLCHAYGVGLLVMPCPEIACLGPARQRAPGVSIGTALRADHGVQGCAALARAVADRIQASLDAGTAVLAVLGGNERSPGCAVHETTQSGALPAGVFIEALQGELRRRGLAIPFRGLRDAAPALLAEDLDWLRALLNGQGVQGDQAGAAACRAGPTPASNS